MKVKQKGITNELKRGSEGEGRGAGGISSHKAVFLFYCIFKDREGVWKHEQSINFGVPLFLNLPFHLQLNEAQSSSGAQFPCRMSYWGKMGNGKCHSRADIYGHQGLVASSRSRGLGLIFSGNKVHWLRAEIY